MIHLIRATIVSMLFGMTACVIVGPLPVYQAPATGSVLTIDHSVEGQFLRHKSLSVSLAVLTGNCTSQFLGEIPKDDYQTGTIIPSGHALVVTASILHNGLQSSNSLTEGRVFTSKRNATYRVQLLSGTSGYAVDIYENGKKLSFLRPCTY